MPAFNALTRKLRSWDEVLPWLDTLEHAPLPRSLGQWQLPAVLDHLAQSIEMSLQGFPQPKSALFQATAGRAAFAVFKWRVAMRHDLASPIPGAPALNAGRDWRAPALRLRSAVQSFNTFAGRLHPHFAYGQLSKADFALAHALHIANHQDEIALS